MKAFFAILFSCFFMLTTMQQTAILLLYKLNEKTITEKYCVNKKVPGSCCHGKCHLNKTIAKSESENTRNPFSTSNIKIKEVEVYCQQLLTTEAPVLSTPSTTISLYSSSLLEGFSFSLIKPPAVLG
jgi:hypothetical protein